MVKSPADLAFEEAWKKMSASYKLNRDNLICKAKFRLWFIKGFYSGWHRGK